MKLRGSKTEEDITEQLIKSYDGLFHTEEKVDLLNTLKMLFQDMTSAYIIDWIPDQGEDFYTILINTDRIVKVEVERESKSVVKVEDPITLIEYKKGLSKINQIRLAVAIDLAQKAN